MLILLTNDDGVEAEGLWALREELEKLARTAVIAPMREQSASSHCLTIQSPIGVKKRGKDIWLVEGTPTDCVTLGVDKLLDERPVLVVSGINQGANMGDDVSYSGTVAAALEGMLFGIQSLALSVAQRRPQNLSYPASFSRYICQMVLERRLPPNTILNINFPDLPPQQIKGVQVTRLGRKRVRGLNIEKVTGGSSIYLIGEENPVWDGEVDTDIRAVGEGRISITPLHLDLTNYPAISEIENWDFNFESSLWTS